MNKSKNKMAAFTVEWATAFVLFFLIVSLAVTITLHFRPLYYRDIVSLGIEESSGYSNEEIRANYDALIAYNSIFGNRKSLEFPTFPMSETGKIHFEEVKVIFVFFQWAAIACFLAAVVLLRWNKKQKHYKFWKYAGLLSLAIPAGLAALICLNWELVFVWFHKLMFRNDYWIFDAAEDPVIRILPDQFFMHCAVMIVGCVIVGSIGCFLIYHEKRKTLQE